MKIGFEKSSPKLMSQWEELYKTAPNATIFQSPQWKAAWLGAKSGSKVEYLTAFEGKDLVGIFPLCRNPFWTCPVAASASDYLHPLANSPGAELEMMEAIAHRSQMETMLLPRLRRDLAPVLTQTATDVGALANEGNCLSLALSGTYQDYIKGLSKSLRQDIRNGLKCTEISIKSHRGTDAWNGLPILVDLHKKRWRSRGLPGAMTRNRIKFHQRLIASGLDVEVKVLSFKGESSAAIYLLHDQKTTYFYQCGFDPSFGSISPGSLLISDAIKQAFDERKQNFDFLRGNEHYKLRWKPNLRRGLFRAILSPNSVQGRFKHYLISQGMKVENTVRDRLESPVPSIKGA